ncbi:universal stress protein [Nocardioides astragali]|uniref:Universal stress protein n=1 Tax=Nocardioides astragali TaxID=1776736 RepID=A0ABW2MXV4_9ACTN|nr:universal stress protein [Nocardioides astragali]
MSYDEVGAWSGRSHPRGAVVVGYNGKEHARTALVWGAEEAARCDAPLLVLYAANYPGMTVEPGPGLFHRDPLALEAAEEVTARGVAEALEVHPGLWISGATEVTSPAQALTEASELAELLVLGSRGYGRVAGALLGSVAFAVAARATCPVVVVNDEARDRQPGPRHPVVVGTDGSDEGSAAVQFAAERAAGGSASLEVVTCTGGHQVKDVDEEELRASAHRMAVAAAAQARASHPRLAVAVRVEDCPAEQTLVAASSDAGMVVVGTRGRGAFEGLLLGSVSHAVIHGASSAVAVVTSDPA